MKITADTNVLLRAIVADDPDQARIAQSTLERADLIAITATALCELVWVLSRGYNVPLEDVVIAIRRLIDSAKVEADRPLVEAGLAVLGEGGDFADGIIAFEGARLGATVLASFDRKAVIALNRLGRESLLLG